jgi:hypothetical protein
VVWWLRTLELIVGGSRPTEVLSKQNDLLNIFLASQFIRKSQNYYLTHWTAKLYEQQQIFRYASRFSGKLGAIWEFLLLNIVCVEGCRCSNTRFPPKNLQILKGCSFTNFKRLFFFYTRQGLRIFCVKIPRPHNSSGSSEIILSTRTSWSSG